MWISYDHHLWTQKIDSILTSNTSKVLPLVLKRSSLSLQYVFNSFLFNFSSRQRYAEAEHILYWTFFGVEWVESSATELQRVLFFIFSNNKNIMRIFWESLRLFKESVRTPISSKMHERRSLNTMHRVRRKRISSRDISVMKGIVSTVVYTRS